MMKHNGKHLPWLQSKAAELDAYKCKTPWYEYENSYSWRSMSDPMFEDLYGLCYPNGKKTVSMEWLDQLRSLGVAVWYGDSGGLMGRGKRNASLKTQSFGREGNEIIERYFNEVGIPCNLNKAKHSWIILFTVKGTEILMSKIVAPHLPQNRYHKIVI